jgi:beta-mannosidase
VTTSLHEGWTVTALEGPVPEEVRGRRIAASVPGCVTTDLLGAGLVPDPYLDENDALLAWVGRTSWSFETTFEAAGVGGAERCDLVCEGLDTVATVRLNGTVLGTTANMHRSYRFDARPLLVPGANKLEVEFKAPVDTAEQMSAEIGPRPNNGAHPFNAIRKMACNYGWDWGPDLPTAGIWRPIGLDRWRQARIASVRPLVSVTLAPAGSAPGQEMPWADDGSPRTADAVVEFNVELVWAGQDDLPVCVVATVAGATVAATAEPGQATVVLGVPVPGVELWWPAGYGGQRLYEAAVYLDPDGPEGVTAQGALGRWDGRIGFRSVALDIEPDARGKRFGIVVNGRSILVRGANWIPDDCFPSRVSRGRYRRQLERARAANCNLLRVWGGGIYESEDFYDAADELGLLVWQDFLLACAAYAEEEPLRSEFQAEVREAVTRLSAHPTLAVWSGGNESLWLHDDWGWDAQLGGQTWGPGYYLDMFPAIVGELDPTRPYMAGSPWSFTPDVYANDARFGSMHVWDVWNKKDYAAYREHQPQFVAEFGFQGPPAWSTLARAVSQRPLSPSAPAVVNHQKANDGMGKLARGLAPHFPEPHSFDDWHWAMSLNQARAVTLAIEYWRSLAPRCRGTIVWQLNDCWPVISWAAIDGDERLKPMWYALRRAHADRLLTIQPTPGGPVGTDRPWSEGLSVVAINDSGQRWDAQVDLVRQSFDGEVLAQGTFTVTADPGQSVATVIGPDLVGPQDPNREVLVASSPGQRALWFYAEDKDLVLPAPALKARVEPADDGFDVVVEASTLQRDVAILADRVDPEAVCDDMLFTLLPGESRRVRVRTKNVIDPEELTGDRVLRSANQLCPAGKVTATDNGGA